LHVDDPLAALRRLIQHLEPLDEQFSRNPAELKDLQLPAANSSCISLPTCGRSVDFERLSRCRRQAA